MFESILGHRRQLKVLEEDLKQDRLSHAYLFVGPEEVGKSAIVKCFVAQALAGHDFDCGSGSCSVCRDIRVGLGRQLLTYWDTGESMKVEEVRGILERLQLKSVEGTLFCVVENIERMTHAAANAFLKMLEEPSEGVVFLFLSVHVQKVLPTVLSRVRRMRFSDVGEEVLKEYLARRGMEEHEVSNILRLSGGKVGLVMKLMEKPEMLERYTHLHERVVTLLERGDLIDYFSFAEEVTRKEEEKGDHRLLIDVLRFMALIFREKGGVEEHAVSLRAISEARYLLLNTNVNRRLLLEHLLLQL